MNFLKTVGVLAIGLLPTSGGAHEFWIDPVDFMVPSGGALVATLRVGETFAGAEQSYLERNFARFDMKCGDALESVPGRSGDRPALNVGAPQDGLCVIVHQTKDYTLTYSDWQKFVNFVEHKDFQGVLAEHAARGLPETGFVELYSRYAKSLIAVSDGAGADAEVGLVTEIVAEANPYTDDMTGGLPIRVLYNGAPRADAQVELFARPPSGEVEVTLHRTDAEGRVTLPVDTGYSYLADAVVLRPLEPKAEKDPVWESLWASLTFAVPE
ncbi:MAG: DUF4198 domain-containing protein [Rhodobacteraceae bacterium]|jgi:uncharacterized GH25 family protein|nr:DUF4198 domain-containing protein [Paracoccaceae bacterium]